jgi:AAA+ ATPase superfamily predicted ATPase
MFIGRAAELATLRDRYASDTFEFGIVYGRRRVGKTTLLKESVAAGKSLFFVANQTNADDNLDAFSRCIADYFGEPGIAFRSFQDAFAHLFGKSAGSTITVILDEFTYLVESDPSIMSVLQNAIDRYRQTSCLKLVVAGSQVGMIEEMLAYKKPLYGRRTFLIHLKEYDYYESSLFYPNYSSADKIRAYAVFGGLPFHLVMIDDDKPLKKNIIDLIVRNNAPLESEISLFLQAELRSVGIYSSVLLAIANGATKLSEIDTKAHVHDSSKTSGYVRILADLGIVRREICFGEKADTRKTLYRMADNFFAFHYRFIAANLTQMTVMSPDRFYATCVAPVLDHYVSDRFETVCMEYLVRKNRADTFPYPFTDIGRYWYHDRVTKTSIEIDLCIAREQGDIIAFECKWTRAPVDLKVMATLEKKSAVLPAARVGAFSLSRVAPEVAKRYPLAFSADDLFQ